MEGRRTSLGNLKKHATPPEKYTSSRARRRYHHAIDALNGENILLHSFSVTTEGSISEFINLHCMRVTVKREKIFNCLNLTRWQLVSIAVLVAILEFFLSLWTLRTESTPDPSVSVAYWGFPFEAIKVTKTVFTGVHPDIGRVLYVTQTFEYIWGGIIVNIIVYIVFSVIVVKLVAWILDEIEYRRYYKLAS